MTRFRDLATLARYIRWAYLAVDAAIPLPFETAGLVMAEAGPAEEHLMQFREAAFTMALGDMLDSDYYVSPADLAELEKGRIPASRDQEG